MTAKRFIQPDKECRVIKNTKTGETAIYYDTEDGLMFLKWLNNLSDENEQLKQELIYWKELLDNNLDLQEENERLKNNIKEAYNNERTMIGKSVLKQLMETIQ